MVLEGEELLVETTEVAPCGAEPGLRKVVRSRGWEANPSLL